MKKAPRFHLCLSIMTAMMLFIPASYAQTATPTATKLDKQDEPILLSPFTVNTDKDNGYQAGDSLIGGRLATNAIMTPGDDTILTRDFLDDIAATSYLDAAAYLTNTYNTPASAADFGNSPVFRGLAAGYPSRNFFRYTNVVDFFSADRLEGARGPNAILFGDGVTGGVLNTTTKQAKIGQKIDEVSLRTDSEGSLRATADANYSLNDKMAVRVNLMKDNELNWVDTYYQKKWGAQLAAIYRPTKNDEIRIDAEAGESKTNYFPQSISDSASNWNGIGLTGPLATNPVGATGIARFTTDHLIYGPDSTGVINYRNYGLSIGSSLAISPASAAYIPNFPSIARNFSRQTSNEYADIRYYVAGIFYEHRWSDRLITEIAFQSALTKRWSDQTRFNTYSEDVNQTRPTPSGGTEANPNFGKPYVEASPFFARQDNAHTDYRLATAYEVPIDWWKSRLNLLLSRRIETFKALYQQYGRSNNTAIPNAQDSNNLFFYRQYLDDPVPDNDAPPTSDPNYTFRKVTTNNAKQFQQLRTIQLATTNSFWDDRGNLVAGLRRDYYTTHSRNTTNLLRTQTSTGDLANSAYSYTQKSITANTSTVGFVLFPIPQLGPYVNYSQTFNPVGAGDASLSGNQFTQTRGVGKSAGLRFKLFNQRIIGSIGYYDTKESGRVVAGDSTNINLIRTNEIDPAVTDHVAYYQPIANFRDSLSQASKGYELDLVANLTKSLRLRGNFALPKTVQSNALPDTVAYYNANIATWEAGLLNPLLTAQNVLNAKNGIANLYNNTIVAGGQSGRVLNGTPDFSGSLFLNYTLPSGLLENASVGGGVTTRGRTVIGNQIGQVYNYIYSSQWTTYTLTAGYSFKLYKRNIRLQLNVDNLFDYKDPVYTNVRAPSNYSGAAVNIRNGFFYFEPRKYLLTATLDF